MSDENKCYICGKGQIVPEGWIGAPSGAEMTEIAWIGAPAGAEVERARADARAQGGARTAGRPSGASHLTANGKSSRPTRLGTGSALRNNGCQSCCSWSSRRRRAVRAHSVTSWYFGSSPYIFSEASVKVMFFSGGWNGRERLAAFVV